MSPDRVIIPDWNTNFADDPILATGAHQKNFKLSPVMQIWSENMCHAKL